MGKKIVRPNDRELGKRTAHTGSEAQEERAGSGTDTRLPYIYIGCCFMSPARCLRGRILGMHMGGCINNCDNSRCELSCRIYVG
jgi:hypothetical protein